MARGGMEPDPFLRALLELGGQGLTGGLSFVSSVGPQFPSSCPAHLCTHRPDTAPLTPTSVGAAHHTKRQKMRHPTESLTSKSQSGILNSGESIPRISPCWLYPGSLRERRTRGWAALLPQLPPQCSQSEPPAPPRLTWGSAAREHPHPCRWAGRAGGVAGAGWGPVALSGP